MTTNKTATEIPDKDLKTLLEIITGAAAIGHALALLKPEHRSRTLLHLLDNLPVMRKQSETTELFIVEIAIQTCNDPSYPERLEKSLIEKAKLNNAANDD